MNATAWWATFAVAGAIVSAAAITQIGIEQQKQPTVEIQYQPYVITKPVIEKQVQIRTVVKTVTKQVIKEVQVPVEVPVEVEVHNLPACEQEDSQNCYWDASTMGNGTGRSFVNLNGTYFYAE